MIECDLFASKTQTSYGPLCALGHHLTQNEVLGPLERVEVPQKTIKHSPKEKITDALLGILAGCSALYQLDVKVRPDLPLRRAFGHESCADQSTIQHTFDAFTEENVAQLRGAVEDIQHQNSKLFSHDFEREKLVLEVDLTGLPASREAEGSTKGYFASKRNRRWRQLVRVAALDYGEIVFEKLHAGNTTSQEVLKETIMEVERILELDHPRRQATLIRLDGGFGTDANLNWPCWRGYQFIAKGYSHSRAKKVAASVPEDDWRAGPTPSQAHWAPPRSHTATGVRRPR